MVKLRQVIGSILSEVTKGQTISDAYSRELKTSYREDSFLKLLSVPRVEINEVVIELKFVVNQPEYVFLSTLAANYKEKGVNGQNVKLVGLGALGGEVISLCRQTGEKTWVWEDLSEVKPKALSQLDEISRDEWSVYLQKRTSEDQSEASSVQIDLHTQVISVKEGQGEYQPLADVLSASLDLPTDPKDEDIEELDIEVFKNQLAGFSEVMLSSISLKLNITSV
jgi:hypothetical protein